MIKNVVAIIDGAAGSCGKAKVIGEIATNKSVNLGASVTNCMPNAGHTFVDRRGNKTIFRNIPVAAVNPKTELFIGPGSAIDMEVFDEEYSNVIKYIGDRKIYVHELVPLIKNKHKNHEKKVITSGSTFKGCGAVVSDKIMRERNLKFFRTFKNAIVCSNDEWLERLYKHLDNPNEYVMLEGAQGCDLDLNHSGNYPYVTSRNVSTTQMLADTGISSERLLQTIMVIRPFPIRISNITKSGDYIYTGSYGTGDELTWTQINLASMYERYPYKEDISCYGDDVNIKEVKKIINECPDIYLKQLFGQNYQFKDITSITLIEALELERLVYKSKGQHEYKTKLINLEKKDVCVENIIIDQSEQTTVTKMERRIFDLDILKLKTNCQINTPSSLYLNFFEHLGIEYKEKRGNFDEYYFSHYLREYLNWIESETNTPISALGTGPKNGDMILKKEMIKSIKY